MQLKPWSPVTTSLTAKWKFPVFLLDAFLKDRSVTLFSVWTLINFLVQKCDRHFVHVHKIFTCQRGVCEQTITIITECYHCWCLHGLRNKGCFARAVTAQCTGKEFEFAKTKITLKGSRASLTLVFYLRETISVFTGD